MSIAVGYPGSTADRKEQWQDSLQLVMVPLVEDVGGSYLPGLIAPDHQIRLTTRLSGQPQFAAPSSYVGARLIDVYGVDYGTGREQCRVRLVKEWMGLSRCGKYGKQNKRSALHNRQVYHVSQA